MVNTIVFILYAIPLLILEAFLFAGVIPLVVIVISKFSEKEEISVKQKPSPKKKKRVGEKIKLKDKKEEIKEISHNEDLISHNEDMGKTQKTKKREAVKPKKRKRCTRVTLNKKDRAKTIFFMDNLTKWISIEDLSNTLDISQNLLKDFCRGFLTTKTKKLNNAIQRFDPSLLKELDYELIALEMREIKQKEEEDVDPRGDLGYTLL